MSKRNLTLYLILLVVMLVALVFIYRSNDHQECDTLTKTIVDENGIKTVTTAHVCKERFNF